MLLDPRALWTRDDVAEYLSVTPRQIDNLRAKLPAPIYVGRLPRWKAGEVMQWVDQQREAA
jgi:predicted DNA-binding transcriptional regulator AlpA